MIFTAVDVQIENPTTLGDIAQCGRQVETFIEAAQKKACEDVAAVKLGKTLPKAQVAGKAW
jgi:hypothetical protein